MTHRDHLVAMLAILKRQGGFMRPVDQCAVREAEASAQHLTLGYACDEPGCPANTPVETAILDGWTIRQDGTSDRCPAHGARPAATSAAYVRVVRCADPNCLASIDDVLIASSTWHREVGHGGVDWCPVHAPPWLARGTETTIVRGIVSVPPRYSASNVAVLRDNAETDALIAAEKLTTSPVVPVVPVVVPLEYKPPRRRLQPKSTAIAERIAARERGELPRLAISRRRKDDSLLGLANRTKLHPRVVTPTPRATFDIHDGAVTETTKERA